MTLLGDTFTLRQYSCPYWQSNKKTFLFGVWPLSVFSLIIIKYLFQALDLKDTIENNMLLMCWLTVAKSRCPSYSNAFLSFPHSAIISSSSRSAGTLRHEGLSDLGLYMSSLLFLHTVNRPCWKYTLIFQEHVKKKSVSRQLHLK